MSYLKTKSFQASCIFLTLVAAESVIRRQTDVAFHMTSGFGPGALPVTPENVADQALFAAAGRTPNISTSVNFSYADNEEWIWQVNITNVPLDDSPNTSDEGLVVTNLQFDLQWPGGGTIQSYLDNREGTGSSNPALSEVPLCAGSYSWGVQPNISSHYPSEDNGSCTNVLGEQCAESLLAVMQEGACNSFRNSLSSGLAGCEDTFDIVESGGGSQIALGDSTDTISNGQNQPLASGDSIFYVTYRPGPASKVSSYERAQTRLNMLYLGGGYLPGGSIELVLLCQVVNSSVAQAVTSGAAGMHPGMSLGAVAALIVLLAML